MPAKKQSKAGAAGGELAAKVSEAKQAALLKQTKQLSHSEKQMLRTARDLLVKELAVARASSEDQVAKELDSMFKN